MSKSKKKWKRLALKWRGTANASMSAHHRAELSIDSLTEEVHSLVMEKKNPYNIKLSCPCGRSVSVVTILPDVPTKYNCPACYRTTVLRSATGSYL